MRLLPERMNAGIDITEARMGSPEAVGRIYSAHAEALMRVAFRLTGSHAEAEDIVQDVFVGLPEALRRYTEQGQFAAWLKRITVRYALMRLRKIETWAETPIEFEGSPHVTQPDISLRTSIADALAGLSQPLRTVLVLHLEGFSHTEIGNLLGIRPGTSEVRLFRARARLRASLGEFL
jgi:RNA polymerase sigma-70 factor (ECF subfamily)